MQSLEHSQLQLGLVYFKHDPDFFLYLTQDLYLTLCNLLLRGHFMNQTFFSTMICNRCGSGGPLDMSISKKCSTFVVLQTIHVVDTLLIEVNTQLM